MNALPPPHIGSPRLSVLACLTAFAACLNLSAQTYTITELPPLPGDTYGSAFALNESGQAAGNSESRAVIWTNGVPANIQTLAGSSVAFALNDAGHAAGDISAGATNSGGFIYRGSTMERITAPTTPIYQYIVEAYAMNNAGTVVGTGGTTFGWRWNSDSYLSLNRLSGDYSAYPYAINGFGIAAGRSSGPGGNRPVTWVGTSPQPLPLPAGATNGFAWGINDLGAVVGEYYPGSGTRPFLWSSGVGAQDLPLPVGATSGYAWSINDAGTIIGSANGQPVVWRKNSSGIYEAVLLAAQISNATGWSGLSLYAINNAGQIAGDGVLNGNLRGFILTPGPSLRLGLRTDTDRSGTTDFDGPADATAPGRPFYFWTNDDHDNNGSELNDGPADSADTSISTTNQIRDLEDFARLALNLTSELQAALASGATLTLETKGAGQIHLFPTTSAGSETAYLTDEAAAAAQFTLPGGNVALSGMVSGDGLTTTWENIQQLITPTDWTSGRLRFLWEGVTPGACSLTLHLKQSDGSEIISDPVLISLRPVREYFEHVRATPENGFPPPYETNGTVPAMSREVVHSQLVTPFGEQNVDLVWVHGWRLTDFERQNWAEMMFKRLWHGGYRGRLHAFTWPTLSGDEFKLKVGPSGLLSFDRSEFRAWKSGIALDGYLRALRTAHSGGRLALLAHSMGNVVTGEALRRGAPADLQIMMQAALSAGCYDVRQDLDDISLLSRERLKQTPDFDVELGYRGFLSHVTVPTINYHNTADFALGLWLLNQYTKPDNPIGKGSYEYRDGLTGFYSGKKLLREVTDVHESLAFLARSRTLPIGSQPLTNYTSTGQALGSFINRLDLNAEPFVFNSAANEHSAQFNRPIQRQMITFYTRLRKDVTAEAQ